MSTFKEADYIWKLQAVFLASATDLVILPPLVMNQKGLQCDWFLHNVTEKMVIYFNYLVQTYVRGDCSQTGLPSAKHLFGITLLYTVLEQMQQYPLVFCRMLQTWTRSLPKNLAIFPVLQNAFHFTGTFSLY